MCCQILRSVQGDHKVLTLGCISSKSSSVLLELILADKLPCITRCLTAGGEDCPAQCITGSSFPSTEDIYTKECLRKACSIMKHPSHPFHGPFTPLLSGRRLQRIWTKSSELLNSFFPQAGSQTSEQICLTDTYTFRLKFHLNPILIYCTTYCTQPPDT